MKNDTKTHAANPADNAPAQHTPENLVVGFSQTGTGDYTVCLPNGLALARILDLCGETSDAERALAELFASAPRLKRERDEALAMLKRVQEIFECGEDLSNINFFGTEQNQIRALIARIEKGGAS